jgi:hypothetical protein
MPELWALYKEDGVMNDKIKDLDGDVWVQDEDKRGWTKHTSRPTFPPLYQTEDELEEKEPEWPKVRWPKDNPFFKTRLQPINLNLVDEIDNPVWQLAERLCASLVDKENEAIVQAITKYAKEEGFTELILIDKEFIRDAIKKQIPQKPNYEGDGYDDSGNLIYDTWICPNCEDRYEVDYEIHSHCPTCGQAIDWEVKE